MAENDTLGGIENNRSCYSCCAQRNGAALEIKKRPCKGIPLIIKRTEAEELVESEREVLIERMLESMQDFTKTWECMN